MNFSQSYEWVTARNQAVGTCFDRREHVESAGRRLRHRRDRLDYPKDAR
jgi:hypothetical protein